MLLSPAILAPIRVVVKAKVARENFTVMTLVALLTPIFTWHYQTLCHMAINEASLIVVKGDQLPDSTTVASLATSLSGARVTQMHTMSGPKVSIMATKAMVIMSMVIVIVVVMSRPMVGPMPYMPMASRGI